MSLMPRCYAKIKSTGKVGRVSNKYRDPETRKITWGIDWSEEFESSELERITHKEYHATADELKITSYETGLR